VDNFRPPYGRVAIDAPRQCIFVGTVNHDHYLKDETGNRRFWPVRTGIIDTESLRRDRDQIWAEAYMLYSTGHPWHLESQSLQEEAEYQQRDRFDEDVWQSLIDGYCVRHLDVSIEEILLEVLNKPQEHWGQQDKNRVGRCLTAIGFERYRVSRPETTGGRPWRYRRNNSRS
jgi:putative DNA primase/helicase